MKITIKVTDEVERRGEFGYKSKVEQVYVDCADQTFTPTLTANFLRALADEIAPRRRDAEGQPILADWEREILYGQQP
jgi:hypothetical protein